jgi:hypothetical protein
MRQLECPLLALAHAHAVIFLILDAFPVCSPSDAAGGGGKVAGRPEAAITLAPGFRIENHQHGLALQMPHEDGSAELGRHGGAWAGMAGSHSSCGNLDFLASAKGFGDFPDIFPGLAAHRLAPKFWDGRNKASANPARARHAGGIQFGSPPFDAFLAKVSAPLAVMRHRRRFTMPHPNKSLLLALFALA